LAIIFPIVVQIYWWAIASFVFSVEPQSFWIRALITSIAMCIVLWFVLRVNLERLDREILWRLTLLKLGPNQMFREFG